MHVEPYFVHSAIENNFVWAWALIYVAVDVQEYVKSLNCKNIIIK